MYTKMTFLDALADPFFWLIALGFVAVVAALMDLRATMTCILWKLSDKGKG